MDVWIINLFTVSTTNKRLASKMCSFDTANSPLAPLQKPMDPRGREAL